ncbi:NADH:flavin oxidoreductase/NADH oxidase [Massilia sp. CF038]|uniref:NADH:flavin oxidoreductase/NADH oxidase n=1 Tax=Massilia sp. CF038 TaxID=1881045 RepID=UPI00091F72BE|nr:NADH:flavin oxidoreductase/NADH oxidase [Massilia sp. CF038]SHG61944.1 2,4-dienoyl-CoA reductase [Massilia sp. CF038]
MSKLFSSYKIGPLELSNRIIIAPMCQYSAEEGSATDWHLIHLGNLALSGAGLLILEATAVSPEARISPADLGLYSDANEEALARMLATIRRHSDIPVGMQISHAGRKASTAPPWDGGGQVGLESGGWQTEGPSALPYAGTDRPPIQLDTAGLARVRDAFAHTARRAARLGLDMLELHAAHGYLLHQFLSPLSNQRDDQYGGSLENRMRFPLEVFDAVRAAFPSDRPVGVRISATDWVEGGWDVDQSVAFSHALAARGSAYVHVSSGGLSAQQKIEVGPGYQLAFAREIKRQVAVPVIGVGMITTPEQAESAIRDGSADLVALARGILYDPRWPWHAAAALGAQVKAPKQYWRSQPAAYKGLFQTDK